ncbi:MAG: gliding motility-associated C-terminal domain-containing protein, partial [Bacteroidota bacterium]
SVDTILVSLYDQLEVGATGADALCFGDSSFVAVDVEQGGLMPYSYSWTADGEVVSDLASQWVTPAETEVWCLTLSDACETPVTQDCVEIVVDEEIPTTFVADTLGGCHPFLVNFTAATDAEDAIADVVWDFGDGAISNQIHTASHNYTTDDLYTVSYTVTSEIGCVYSTVEEDYILVKDWPLADFTTDPVTAVLPNTGFDFTNFTLNADEYTWYFDGYGESDEFEPSFDFPAGQTGSYVVSLEAINDLGCRDSIARQVLVVEDFVIYVPNAFTPDNDGINDVFGIQGIDIDPDEFSIFIFDSWGEVVYNSENISDTWDGSVNGGEYYAADGIYLFRIETRAITSGEPKEITGHITLIR